MKKNEYTIVFSVDYKYVCCLEVALLSLIDVCNKQKQYNVFILNNKVEIDKLSRLKQLSTENVKIDFIDVNEYVNGKNLYEINHFTKAMYYRILIPKIFSNKDKVLYLDCDITILKDPAILFEENLENYELGACLDLHCDDHKDYLEKININPEKYFNSGILLFNVNEFLKNNIETKFFEILDQNQKFSCPDQDALNLVCKNVKLLNFKWNFQWGATLPEKTGFRYREKFKQQYLEDKKDPYIIHYASKYKPWNLKKEEYSKYWWKYANQINKSDLNRFIKKDAKVKYPFKQKLKMKTTSILNKLFGVKFVNKLRKFIHRKNKK